MQNIMAAIATSRGILVIDTGPSVEAASQARDLIGKHFNRSDILWVLHTHGHWDHIFGSQAFRGAQFIGHEQTAQSIRESSRSLSQLKGFLRKNGGGCPYPAGGHAGISSGAIRAGSAGRVCGQKPEGHGVSRFPTDSLNDHL